MNLESKIKKLFNEQNFQKIRTKKLITALKIMIIDREKDLSKVAEKASLTLITLKKYIKDKDLLLSFLSNYEYEEFLLILKEIEKEEIKIEAIKKYELYRNVIDEILTTRYLINDVAIHNYIQKDKIEEFLSDTEYIKENFGEEKLTKLKFRVSETNIIRQSAPRNKHVVEEAELLEIIDQKIKYVDDFELKIIKVTANYLLNGADIEYVKDKMEMPIESIFNYITDPRLSTLLKEEYKEKLENYLKIEKIMRQNDLNVKRDFLLSVYNVIKQNNYDLNLILNEMQIPINLFKKILDNPFTSYIIPREELHKINDIFINEQEKNNKVSRTK